MITKEEKEMKSENFGVVYGCVLELIPPNVRRKEELYTREKAEGVVVFE